MSEQWNEDGQSSDGGSGIPGWVIWIGIFGIGNFVLYKFTGIFLIPIPRK